MPRICYVEKHFNETSRVIISQANEIIQSYMSQGFKLTLRQLYYQFVARGLLSNTVQCYKRLGSIVNDARLAGRIDWNAIEDRTRNLARLSTWDSPQDIMSGAASGYRTDKWAKQPYRVEVWIEKEALAGVFAGVCDDLEVPYFSCRGYTSQSEMWAGAMRLTRQGRDHKTLILHFGDHDPSGMDMTRDIVDRMNIFGCPMRLDRLALNMDQVDQYKPPPNPAKTTDSRYAAYIQRYGGDSWELDALEPAVLSGLVRTAILRVRNSTSWTKSVGSQESERTELQTACDRWEDVVEYLQ